MSKVNFLKVKYRVEPSRNEAICGIVDGMNEAPAYTTIDSTIKWEATINNSKLKTFQFVPIDKNIIWYKPNSKDKESSCDGMILVNRNEMLVFVELKDWKSGGGLSKAVDQLRVTIKCFHENHRYSDFRVRRAYAANRHRSYFHYSRKDEIDEFNKQLHFSLHHEAEIDI